MSHRIRTAVRVIKYSNNLVESEESRDLVEQGCA